MYPKDIPDKGKCKNLKCFLGFSFLVLNFNFNFFLI